MISQLIGVGALLLAVVSAALIDPWPHPRASQGRSPSAQTLLQSPARAISIALRAAQSLGAESHSMQFVLTPPARAARIFHRVSHE
jgi:hypothetical protein